MVPQPPLLQRKQSKFVNFSLQLILYNPGRILVNFFSKLPHTSCNAVTRTTAKNSNCSLTHLLYYCNMTYQLLHSAPWSIKQVYHMPHLPPYQLVLPFSGNYGLALQDFWHYTRQNSRQENVKFQNGLNINKFLMVPLHSWSCDLWCICFNKMSEIQGNLSVYYVWCL